VDACILSQPILSNKLDGDIHGIGTRPRGAGRSRIDSVSHGLNDASQVDVLQSGCDGKFANVFGKYLILKGLKRTDPRKTRR
jgi:hypothetical protein